LSTNFFTISTNYIRKNLDDQTTNRIIFQSVVESTTTPVINVSNVLTIDTKAANTFLVYFDNPIGSWVFSNTTELNTYMYSFTLQLCCDGTARSITWPTGTRWSGGTLPTLTTNANKVDTFVFSTRTGGSEWYAHMVNTNQ
jgi:hypothetical protein